MTTSREEADQMIGATNKAGKKLMIGHNQCFVVFYQKVQ
jgi:UDP-N-acetylglucosamine 3-dehydrogenase